MEVRRVRKPVLLKLTACGTDNKITKAQFDTMRRGAVDGVVCVVIGTSDGSNVKVRYRKSGAYELEGTPEAVDNVLGRLDAGRKVIFITSAPMTEGATTG